MTVSGDGVRSRWDDRGLTRSSPRAPSRCSCWGGPLLVFSRAVGLTAHCGRGVRSHSGRSALTAQAWKSATFNQPRWSFLRKAWESFVLMDWPQFRAPAHEHYLVKGTSLGNNMTRTTWRLSETHTRAFHLWKLIRSSVALSLLNEEKWFFSLQLMKKSACMFYKTDKFKFVNVQQLKKYFAQLRIVCVHTHTHTEHFFILWWAAFRPGSGLSGGLVLPGQRGFLLNLT